MTPLTALLSIVILLTIAPAFYAVYLKLSARFLQYHGITWKHGFAFGLIVLICSLLVTSLLSRLVQPMPMLLPMLTGLTVNWLMGSWFFSGRKTDAGGERFGWEKSMKLTGLALAMLGLSAALLMGVPKMLMQKGGEKEIKRPSALLDQWPFVASLRPSLLAHLP